MGRQVNIHLKAVSWQPVDCLRGLPFSTYAPRGGGGFNSPIHFHCVLHAKRGGGGPDSM